MRDLAIAYGTSRQAKKWVNKTVSFADLKERLKTTIRTTESAEEYAKMGKASKDQAKDHGGFVAGALKGGRRKIDTVELRSMVTLDDRADGKVIKSISFKFPLAFDGKELKANNKDGGIIFSMDCSCIDIDLPVKGDITMQRLPDGTQKVIVKKPTYKAIKNYVMEQFGVHVSSLNIAQTKRKYGVDIGEAYNKPANPKSRVPRCTPEKEKYILEAFKHYDLVDEDTKYKEGEDK